LKSITIPKNVNYIDPGAFADSPLTSISVEAGNCRFSACDNFLVDVIDSVAVLYFGSSCVKFCDAIRVLGKFCFAGRHLREFRIPRSIEIIQEDCFKNCLVELLTFEAESRLVRIERSCFDGSFSTVCAPASPAGMGEGSFAGGSIEMLTFESINRTEHKWFEGVHIISMLIPRSVEVVGCRCFASCELCRVECEAESRLVRIEQSCFSHATISSITVPASVEILCDSCFAGCQLEAFIFEQNSRLVRIERSCFAKALITAICIPRSVEILGDLCFQGAHGAMSVCYDQDYNDGWSSVNEHTRYQTQTNGFLLTFESDSRLRTIGASCFLSACIKSIFIPRSVEILGPLCFYEANSAIETKPVEHIIETISGRTWKCEGCLCNIHSQVTESFKALPVTFESGSKVTRIDDGAFSRCSIESICIPRSVQSLGASCFEEANGGAQITPNVAGGNGDGNPTRENQYAFPIEFESDSKLERIEAKCFANCLFTSIRLPRSLNFVGESAFQAIPKGALTLEEGNARFAVDGDILTDVSDRRAVAYVGWDYDATFQKSVAILGKSCFQGASIKSFRCEADSALVTIEEWCFYGSTIQLIDIPGSVESLGKFCFSEAVVVVLRFEENSRLKRIEESCFQCCKLYGPIYIPRSVEELGEWCFYSAHRQGVTIEPDSCLKREDFCFQYATLVTHIGRDAFAGNVIVSRL
jgi:hypothetical protein